MHDSITCAHNTMPATQQRCVRDSVRLLAEVRDYTDVEPIPTIESKDLYLEIFEDTIFFAEQVVL